MRLICTLLAAGAVALLATSPAAPMSHPRLTGTVGPGFTITLKQGGKSVKTLKAGTYKIVVADKSNIHDFHLTGPGVNKSTSVGGTGSKTWTVTLKKGSYKFVCDPHAAFMKGSFTVT
jgi:plastocyanin